MAMGYDGVVVEVIFLVLLNVWKPIYLEKP